MSASASRVLLVASYASGRGKTTWTAGLARHYTRQGRRVRCLKVGPDFLDPMILARASGAEVYSLDAWMGGMEDVRARLAQAASEADVVLIEAMMGLYDGVPSAADLALELDLPVLLVIDAGAMAQTFGAIAHGLSTYRNLRVAGVAANGVASEGHATMLAESLPESLSLWGTVSKRDELGLPERHLGLIQAQEVETLDSILDAIAHDLGDVPLPPEQPLPPQAVAAPSLPRMLEGRRIGVAQDKAFSFVYPANLEVLAQLGANVVPFSPCHDPTLPEVDALYLPGGYPELHAMDLSDNQSMREAVLAHVEAEKPTVAECGGLMYLAHTLTDAHGTCHPMACALEIHVRMQKRLAGLGHYSWETQGDVVRGHAFHYSTLEGPAEPVGTATPKRFGKPEPVFRRAGLLASYVHWYFPSNPLRIARWFSGS